MKITNYILLDFNKTKKVDTQTVQCDMNSRFVRVSLHHNNSPIDLSDVRVCIMAVKPDGKEIFNDCTVIDAQNGLAEFEITKQMGIVVGEVKCQIKLFGKEKLLSSNIFNLSVSRSLSPNSRDSKDQLNTLVESLNRVDEWDDQFQQKYNGLEEEYAHDITEIKGLMAITPTVHDFIDETIIIENDIVDRVNGVEQEIVKTNAQLSDIKTMVENATSIDDSTIAIDKTWSSSKTKSMIESIPKGEKGEKGDPGSASVAIDDSKTNTSQTWSSSKITSELNKKDVNLTNSGIVKGVFLTNYSFKGTVVSLPVSTTRMKIVKADGSYLNNYGNWSKQEYDLSTGGGYLVYDTSDSTTKQVSLPTKAQIVLFGCENGAIRNGYLYDSFIGNESPITHVYQHGASDPTYTVTDGVATVTFVSNYKIDLLKENGVKSTVYISGSGQNVFEVRTNEKLILDGGDNKFKVVPITYDCGNSFLYMLNMQGKLYGHLVDKREVDDNDNIPFYAYVPGGKIYYTENVDGSVTIENPYSKITYAKMFGVYVNDKAYFMNFTEPINIEKNTALSYNALTQELEVLESLQPNNNGYNFLKGFSKQHIILLHNVQGNVVGGEFTRFLEKADEEVYDVISPNASKRYCSKGSTQGICVVGEELWLCSHSNDEHTDYANIVVINKNDFSSIRTISHNLGHLNTVQYNSDNDCLLTTNSSKSYSLPPKIWIYPNWKQQSGSNKLDFDALEKIELDFSWLYEENSESKANPCWGENIDGRNNILYLLTNDNKIIRKVVLGKGTTNMGMGTLILGKSTDEYNGTYKIIDTWIQKDGLGVNGDTVFYKGRIITPGRFTGIGDYAGCYVYQLQTRGRIKKSIIRIDNYSNTGVLSKNDGQGIEIDGDELYFFTDSWGIVVDTKDVL